MLPWVCDLSAFDEKRNFFPQHVNVAQKYVSDVDYYTRRMEDDSGLSFLSFRLFIARTTTDYSKDHKLLISYSEPYSYSRLEALIRELKVTGLVKKASWLNFKVGRLCSSLCGTPLPLIKLTQRQSETVLSVYQKPIIMVAARAHPGEPPGSFLCEGLLRALLNP